jgi:hypothetical protein
VRSVDTANAEVSRINAGNIINVSSWGEIHQTEATFRHLCQKVASEVTFQLVACYETIGENQLSKKRFIA